MEHQLKTDYQLKTIGKVCAGTGKELRPGETCYSAVVEKNNEWVRLDFSAEGWDGPPAGTLGFWKCEAPARPDGKRRALDPDALLRQFEQLCEDANPAHDKFRFVLALLLVQRRRLRVGGTRTEAGSTILELAGMHGEGPFAVREQHLDDAEIEALQRDLNDRLTMADG